MGKNQISPNQSSRAVRAPPEAARRVVVSLCFHHSHPEPTPASGSDTSVVPEGHGYVLETFAWSGQDLIRVLPWVGFPSLKFMVTTPAT
jgi:hypothetical protein